MVRNVKCPHCGNEGNIRDTRKFNIIQRTFGDDHTLYRYSCKECGSMNNIKLFSRSGRLDKQQLKKAMVYRGKKGKIWNAYIQMKRNNDKRLSEFLSDDYNKKVITKKDFDVFQALSSNMYHRRNCGYLSRSRNLRRMSRSDAIIHDCVKCNSCMKEPINPLYMLIGVGIVVMMFVASFLLTM